MANQTEPIPINHSQIGTSIRVGRSEEDDDKHQSPVGGEGPKRRPYSIQWILQLHKDVPKAARFYSEGLDFTVNVCTLRWAELQSGPLKLALLQSPNDHVLQKGSSSHLSFTVTDINSTVTKLMALGAELDGTIKYEIHGKVAAMRCIDGHMLGLYEPA